jgi:hypothetical protein
MELLRQYPEIAAVFEAFAAFQQTGINFVAEARAGTARKAEVQAKAGPSRSNTSEVE